jgi:hypothetical protein
MPVLLGAAVGIGVHFLGYAFWLPTLCGIASALILLLGRGKATEWLIDRRFFHIAPGAGTKEGRATVASLSGRGVDHVICTTDLVLGLPVYASSQHGGVVWRRLHGHRNAWGNHPFQTFSAVELSLAELVRASAAFPGIPPRRLRIPGDPQLNQKSALAFLSDGGVWNNLGSQVIREDGFIGTHAAWSNGVIRPYGPVPEGIPLFCLNGSAPLRASKPSLLQVPGFAFFKSLFQVMEIQNVNTVLPRVESTQRAFARRASTGQRPSFNDPADLIADLRPTDEVSNEYLPSTWTDELIRKSDYCVKQWERSAANAIRLARERMATDPQSNWIDFLLNRPEPAGSFPVCGLANIADWDALRLSPVWKDLVKSYGTGDLSAPTTLGRIEGTLGKKLIARGYLNTYLVSLFLAPLTRMDIDRLGNLSSRFDCIAGG